MAQTKTALSRAMLDVVRSDLVASQANTPDAVIAVVTASVATLTDRAHRISVTPDPAAPDLMRIQIVGPMTSAWLVIAV